MSAKPELIVISQNLLGGGASFHKNMLSHFPQDFFDIKCIYLDPLNSGGAKSLDVSLKPNDVIFSFGNESIIKTAGRLSHLLSDTEGAIVANLEDELISLDLFRKPGKTVFFICHDNGFLPLAIKFESIIDVFIAHNNTVYNDLVRLVGNRKKPIHFIQHGVNIQSFDRKYDDVGKLNIVFLARHYIAKGLYDLPLINELLLKNGIEVEWMILGDGPERISFMTKVQNLANFHFAIPSSSAEVLEVLKTQDIFILPSRNDGLPVALLESMSVGCVPIVSNFSEGIKKVVSENIGFVVPVGDNDSFAACIIALKNDRGLLKTLSLNCVEKVKNEFDIRKQALKYYNLYKDYRNLRSKHWSGFNDIIRRVQYYDKPNKAIHLFRKITEILGLSFKKAPLH